MPEEKPRDSASSCSHETFPRIHGGAPSLDGGNVMSWTIYWTTGGNTPQPLYDQFDYGGCAVGCGPVAWTMLFCWADHQAGTGNAYWAPRWGLYRQNGGYGADVVAPLTMDDGVKNVIREIHNDVGSFCIFGSGATVPWSMPDAWHYLSGRTGTPLEAQ